MYYIGAHKTKELNDGYMGSGKYIRSAIKKHGIENFVKEYISLCNDEEEMYLLEKSLVITSIEDKNSYNLIPGGKGPLANWRDFASKDKISEVNAKRNRTFKERNIIPHNKGLTGIKNPQFGQSRPDMRDILNINNPMKRPEIAKKLSEKFKQTYRYTFFDGRTIVYRGMNEFCKEFGYSQGNLTKVRTGERLKHKDIIKVELLK